MKQTCKCKAKKLNGPSTFDETDPDSDSESTSLFVPYPVMITWNLDKLKSVSLLDDDSTVPTNHVIAIANEQAKLNQELEQEYKQKLDSSTTILKAEEIRN